MHGAWWKYRKRIYGVLVVAILLLMSTSSWSQEISTNNNENLYKKYASPTSRNFTAGYYVVYGKLLPTEQKLIFRRIVDDILIVYLPDENTIEKFSGSYKIAPANLFWKLSPTLEQQWNSTKKEFRYRDYIVSTNDLEILLQQLEANQIPIKTINKENSSVILNTNLPTLFNKILPILKVIFVDEVQVAKLETSIIGYNRSFHGINALDYLLPGINGENIVVGVKEQNMDQADLDLYQRVLPSSLAAPSIQPHATVIASIIGGAGNSFYDGRGLANRAKFYSSSFSNLFADDREILNNNKVSIQNHSYGTVPQQYYGAEALSYDLHCWTNKQFLHVFSSGNRGTTSATDGRYSGISGFANLTGNFKMAKNIITVGAIDNTGNISSESSAGPAYDGRLAPQLIALGPNGTSDAAAIVSGTVALLQQAYANSNNQLLPEASLVKAILYSTADDVASPGIDYKTGFGLVNSYKAVTLLTQKKYFAGNISSNQLWTQQITIPDNTAGLKMTLCWTDSAAQINNNKALINDLDVELREINTGQVYKPWVLNSSPHVDSLRLLPTRGRDSLNTAEQISLILPSPGIYEIRVVGKSISANSISFHIAYSIDSLNSFEFLSPQHSSDVNRAEAENIFVRWRTAIADTNQLGELSISYDRGSSWQAIQTFKIYAGQFLWKIKDTSSSAIFRMKTGFGDFYSKEFVISPVIRPRLDFNCTDSFQLSWPKHIYANAYTIYALADTPFLKKVYQTSDTITVFKKSTFPYLVYAVEPVLDNNIPASRSIAFNIDLQGVNCFYRTLNYEQISYNSLNLILDLSTNRFVDSVSFEVVSAVGVLVKEIGVFKSSTTSLTYTQTVKDLPGGTNYFRAKIKLITGQVVYTNIISILISGSKLILFYPNPVVGDNALNYLLQQGVPGDCSLLLFDASGRLLREFIAIPPKIDISGLQAGVLFYKLIYPDKSKTETGKIVILRR